MTALRREVAPGVRRQADGPGRPRLRAAVLGAESHTALTDLVDRDPFVNAVVAARVRAAGTLAAQRLGGVMAGVHDGTQLTAGCYSGANLVPIGGDTDSWAVLADFLAHRPRRCTSIVGLDEAVRGMWSRLTRHWGPAREVRDDQPLLVLDRPVGVPPSADVVPVQPGQLDRYLCAASAMFTEELGVSPHVAPGIASFRSRMRELISTGRAFASFDFRGQVVFKADIGAVTPHTSQVQGVWVRPDLRGRGIGTASMAAVLQRALELAPTASLYVNDFNVPARRMYERLGMRHHATLSTVLLR